MVITLNGLIEKLSELSKKKPELGDMVISKMNVNVADYGEYDIKTDEPLYSLGIHMYEKNDTAERLSADFEICGERDEISSSIHITKHTWL